MLLGVLNVQRCNNDTIYNCDVCNKHLCSECYRESDNTGYCKDCFSNVSKNIEMSKDVK